jgi:AcrR family transcriptional regulator
MGTKAKSAPSPKQARAQETIEAVIFEANRAMKAGGESAVRVQEISIATKVSIGSIYHHFGDRDGIIRATYVHNYANIVRADIERIRHWIQDMHSTSDMAIRQDEMLSFLVSHFERLPAIERAAIIGNTVGRPLLRDALANVQNELTNGLTEVMQIFKERGMLKSHLHPRAAAVVLLGLLHGKVISDIDTDAVSDHDWNSAMLTTFGGLLNA